MPRKCKNSKKDTNQCFVFPTEVKPIGLPGPIGPTGGFGVTRITYGSGLVLATAGEVLQDSLYLIGSTIGPINHGLITFAKSKLVIGDFTADPSAERDQGMAWVNPLDSNIRSFEGKIIVREETPSVPLSIIANIYVSSNSGDFVQISPDLIFTVPANTPANTIIASQIAVNYPIVVGDRILLVIYNQPDEEASAATVIVDFSGGILIE